MQKLTESIILSIMPNAKATVSADLIPSSLELGDDKSSVSKAALYAALINKYAPHFGLSNDLQMAHFLAQVAHESGEFRYTEELASGAAYEGRKDLGNTHPGDGKRFKGRGLIQITGRINYQAYNDYLVRTGMKVNLIETPELLSKPLGALKSALWFCMRFSVLALALRDTGRTETRTVTTNGKKKTLTYNAAFFAITKRINGGYNGVEDRYKYFLRAKKALKI